MIQYSRGAFNINLLFRVSGSPLYKSIIPSVLAVVIYILIHEVWKNEDNLNHPYAIGVLVASVSFLIIFRANFGYQRYWEACGAVHHFMSKWMDAVQHTGVFHLQCKHYDAIKPPSYFDHPELNKLNLTRDRHRSVHEEEEYWEDDISRKDVKRARQIKKSIEHVSNAEKRLFAADYTKRLSSSVHSFGRNSDNLQDNPEVSIKGKNGETTHLFGAPRLDGGWGTLFENDPTLHSTATHYKPGDEDKHIQDGDTVEGFGSTRGGRTPSLFLQELAHLASLCNAVALATLRNDIEGAESPLDIFHPGEPWPEADPTKLHSSEENEYTSTNKFLRSLQYWLGVDRSPEARTKYNASRPLLVIGGVSDNEIAFLQKAKGPSAKVTLAWSWLSEFIMREHLAGSLGNIGPPIVSRIIQFLSDGMIYYNHARKIMYIPFPFPHAQLSAFFNLTMVPAVPFLMDQYTNELWLGITLTFLVVACLSGLHEVARELENPFRNVPNELPLCTLQAMYNESLVTMYAGFHPDHYWDPEVYLRRLQTHTIDEEYGNENTDEIKRPVTLTPPKEALVDGRIQALQDIMAKQTGEIEKLRQMLSNDVNDTSGMEKAPVLIDENDSSPKKTQ